MVEPTRESVETVGSATATVAEQWEEFRRSTMRGVTNPVQIEEMRRGFYAGFIASISSMSQAADAFESEDEGAAQVEKWLRECQQFFVELIRG